MTQYHQLIQQTSEQLLKAINHLEYSYNKIQKLPLNSEKMDDEILETWESFSSRFARVADIFMMKYIRVKILEGDPGFKGTLRDFLNKAEKIQLVDNAEEWLEIRELRNVSAYEYQEDDLASFYQKLQSLSPILLQLKQKIYI